MQRFARTLLFVAMAPTAASAETTLTLACRVGKLGGGYQDVMMYVDEKKSTVSGYEAEISDDEINFTIEGPKGRSDNFRVNRHTGSIIRTYYTGFEAIASVPGTCMKATERKF